MKAIQYILFTVMVCLWFMASGQQQQSTNAGQQVNEPGQATSAAQQQVTDTTGTANAGSANQTSATASDTTDSAIDPRASNTPAVPQTTTSDSGSPAVLSGDKGADRDGTNNVQRATMNMVGSPADNLSLDDNTTVDANSEMQDRQNYTQEKEVSGQSQSQSRGDEPSSKSTEVNKNSRKQNNALSDQNLTAKEKNKQDSKSNKKK